MKECGKLEMSWHIRLCLNVIIRELTGKSLPFTSPYSLVLSYRYRYCCSIIASTFWRRGKEKERTVCYFYKLLRHCLGCKRLQ